MSDTRFTILGMALIFVGFIVLGVFGEQYVTSTLEAEEFGECFEYSEDKEPVPIDCSIKQQEKAVFFAGVVSLIGAGIGSLIKGVKGKWDQELRPEDMLGPGGDKTVGKKDEPDED